MRLAIVGSRVASASNSETDSIHFSASCSRSGSKLATCFATRRRTAGERASAMTRRNSRRPRARRRCRIILMISAAVAIGFLNPLCVTMKRVAASKAMITKHDQMWIVQIQWRRSSTTWARMGCSRATSFPSKAAVTACTRCQIEGALATA
jgi:hypothetical protein